MGIRNTFLERLLQGLSDIVTSESIQQDFRFHFQNKPFLYVGWEPLLKGMTAYIRKA